MAPNEEKKKLKKRKQVSKCVLDNGRSEKALEITAARELEARDELLRDGGSADDAAALEHGHGEPAASQIGGCGEAVMAPADDQRVPFLVLQLA